MEQIKRVQQSPPALPCYGFGYDSSSPICAKCAYAQACTGICGDCVPLSKATFDFTPEKVESQDEIVDIDARNVRRSTVEDTYRRCYYAIFGRKWPIRVGLGQEWEQIVRNAYACSLTLDTYIGTVMLAYKLTHEHTPFFPKMLTGKGNVEKIEVYTHLCREKCGYTGLDALGICLNEDIQTFDDQMLHSEITAGGYVLSHRLKIGGPPYEALYEWKELTLDPYWLAIEPSYITHVLLPYNAQTLTGTPAQQQHRHRVIQAYALLKRKKTLARTIFAARARAMPKAIPQVLRPFGYPVNMFTVNRMPINDAMFVWNMLARAILHLECLKAVNSEPHTLWR